MDAPFAWTPPPEMVEGCNVSRFARRLGLATVDELRLRSVEDIEWFWDAVVKELPIDFFEPYERVLDASDGPEWARWFVGGRLNVAHNCLDRHADSPGGDRSALIWEGEDGPVRTFSYRELRAETCRVASVLKSLGVGRGDRVALMLPMIPEVVTAFLAVSRIGAIALPIFSGFGHEAVAERLRDSGSCVLVTADGFFRKGAIIRLKDVADLAADSSPTVRHVLVVRRANVPVSMRSGRDSWLEELAEAAPDDAPNESMSSEDPFLIAYTSGTTGRPKGAVHVHGGFLAKIAQEVAHQVDLTPEDRLFWFTDMGWIMGPWEVVGGLAMGGTIVLYEGVPDFPDVDRLWSIVARHRVTILGVSPTLVRSLMKHGDGPVLSHDLASLRILGSTGETWNPGPWRWYFETVGRRRCPVMNFSGGTEVGACFLSPFPTDRLEPGSLGGPSLGMAVDVVDPEGKSVRGQVGELVCRKPWPGMTRGFWNAPSGIAPRTGRDGRASGRTATGPRWTSSASGSSTAGATTRSRSRARGSARRRSNRP